jgi:hypothetical protein
MAYDVLFVDHGNPGSDKTFQQLKNKIPYAVQDQQQIKTSPYWRVSSYADTKNFDFAWQPNVHEKHFTHCGVNNYGLADNGISLEHTVPSELHINNLLKIQRTNKHDIFYVDTGSHQNYKEQLEVQHNVKTTRFFDSWQKVAKRCANKMTSEYCWIVPSDVNPTTIDFSWYPDFWETKYLHIFGSKWQKNSGVMFVHRDWLDDTNEFIYRHDFVVRADVNAYDKFFLDFFDDNSKKAEQSFDVDTHKIRFFDNHLDTIKRLTSKSTTKYFWVLSGNCDYEGFDFTWLPDEETYDHLHTFPSNSQVYGDTFFIDKNSFDIKSKEVTNFKHYETINFNKQQSVKRLPYDTFVIGHYNFAQAIKDRYQDTPTKYFWITNRQATPLPRDQFKYDFAPDYWSPATVYTFGPDNDIMLVPKESGTWITEQVYDYPHIQKRSTHATVRKSMDIIFISYDEPSAVKRWETLKEKFPRAKWCKNIKGQTEAYHTAANMSNTDWFFAVFPKLELVDTFDFEFQPDRLKNPCHYIFNCKNPVNGLEYGHGAVILYNKEITLATTDPGLDFTLSGAHDTVPILSAINHYNQTPWLAWRTAFREVMKLKQALGVTQDVESNYRLKIWLTKAEGKNGEWSLHGSKDASDYYDNYKDSYKDLMKSYDFEWLENFYKEKYA